MVQPKVSIILCTYNRANYLDETIKSIIAQTFENWELMIIDNGSTDGTEKLIREIDDRRIIYEKTGRQRMGPAKNKGIKKATGDLIAFMDDDDLWMPTKLEKQVNAFKDFPEAGFSYTNGYNFRNDDEIIEFFLAERAGVEYGNIFQSYCMGERGIFIQTVMCRKECVELAGYFGDEFFFTDYTFTGNLAYHFNVIILKEPLLKRRLHTSNSGLYVASEAVEEQISAMKLYRQKGMLQAAIARESMFLTRVKTGNVLAIERRFAHALKSYLQAWRIKPFSIIPLKKISRLLLTQSR
ncbi:MAG: glycosyltransferase [Flavipsychrobacter sp.]|jgi:glycosyltransferase involved in cell wall biosynthesis|nr:glycosyltransferase [Flavipsychrobacter sp.]